MTNSKTDTTKTEEKPTITYVERNGKTFEIIEHFSEKRTFTDIIKNALQREFESN